MRESHQRDRRESSTAAPAGSRRPAVALGAAGAVMVGVFLVTGTESPLQPLAFLACLGLAVGGLAAAYRRAAPDSRPRLALLLTAQALYAAVTAVWYLGPAMLGIPLPFPSPIDVLYFVSYAMYAVFLLLLLRRGPQQQASEARLALVDALVLSVPVTALLWVGIWQPNLDAHADVPTTVASMLYPIFTLVLFTLAARLTIVKRLGGSVAGGLLLTWIAGEIVADAIYGYQSAHGSFEYGAPYFSAWMVSYTAIAALAVHPGFHDLLTGVEATGESVVPGEHRWARGLRLSLLLAAALGTVGIAVASAQSRFLLVCALVEVTLVVWRTSLLAGDLRIERSLRAELDRAVGELARQQRQLRAQATQLERLAFHDLVTGLGNRALLRRKAGGEPDSLDATALLLLDLDGFKEINDTLGHAAGDALLLEVASRLGGCVRVEDTVVRLGGDEFAVLLHGTGPSHAERMAERILEELRRPFQLGDTTVQVRGSIGIASGSSGMDLDELLRNADLAMYEAKARGRDRVRVFHPGLFEVAARRLQVETDLRDAITQGELAVYYQPIVDAVSGEIRSVEALVRWDHPTRGVLPPTEFLPAAERTGLVVAVGSFVLRSACRQLAEWRQDWPELSVSVNVSHRELLDPGYTDRVRQVLLETGVPASALFLEITETVFAEEQRIAEVLTPLADLGVRFAIDDFGTGHSSLSRLRSLAVNRLKIDKAFVADIPDGDKHSAPLLASIIALAHSVGLEVVAEGVETSDQADFLAAHQCDELQGYHLSRPVAAGSVIPILISTGTATTRERSELVPSARFVWQLADISQPLEQVLPPVLRELSRLSGLECCFFTEVDEASAKQVTRLAHNVAPDTIRIQPGLAVDWPATVCRRMLADGISAADDVSRRYGDLEAATTLGIETYITVPITDRAGRLRGTLCAASPERRPVDDRVVELMRVFTEALGARLEPATGRAAATVG